MPSRLDFEDDTAHDDRVDRFAIVFCFTVVLVLILVYRWMDSARQANSSRFTTAEFQQQLNAYRRASGSGSLRIDPRLTQAARKHAEWCLATGTLGHEGPDGETFVQRVNAAGYQGSAVTENFAFLASEPTAGELLQAWRSSPGHDAGLKMPATDSGVWVTPTSPSYCVWVSGSRNGPGEVIDP